MVKPRILPTPKCRSAALRILLLLLAFFGLATPSAKAAIQFDVFLGYDSVVPEATWFPIVCEVKNDGPAFTGVIEVSSGSFNQSQTRRIVVELPTGTLKRLVIPVFSTARYQSSWDVRLLDERGRVRDEKPNQRPKRQLASATTLIGAIPRTANGVPIILQIRPKDTEIQPISARIQSSLLPDNPLVLEGMDTIYLSSEKAVGTELNVNQYNAILAWLNAGGHLIVGIEQMSEVNATPWLKSIVPCQLTGFTSVTNHNELQQWLRAPFTYAKTSNRFQQSGVSPFADLAEDATFEKTDLQVVTGTVQNGQVLVSSGGTPLVVTSRQGRGRVTVLMFSPEREPFRSWKNNSTFWAKIAGVPPELYTSDNAMQRGGWSIDGVFGAMIDSKQIRKLPVEWLLLLLIVYLLVIGPLDQYWLKRIKRPMLTWITFPCYVVLFSLLIYFIGYKLRAGETEWNELHLVDVFVSPANSEAHLRGRTYASIYSPVNATYKVESDQQFSTFRGEFQSSWNGGGQDSERADIYQNGDNFKAEIFVPVWTSQLYVSDWWQPAAIPIAVGVAQDGSNWSVTITNQLDRPLANAHVVIGNRIIDLGELPASQRKTFKVSKEQGSTLNDFVRRYGSGFQHAVQSRQQAFGASGSGRIVDLPHSSIAISFLSHLAEDHTNPQFVAPPGLDISQLADQGNAVLLAWESDYSPVKSINQFPTRRSHKDTLWRVSVPIHSDIAP